MTENNNDRVIVIAGSSEGIAALARLIRLLPSSLPAPLVAYVHDLHDEGLERLMRKSMQALSGLAVVEATDGDRLLPGHLYLAQAGNDMVFTAMGVLAVRPSLEPVQNGLPADRLFESAALFYGRRVIGVVLSGSGDDGTRGLNAIFHAGGISVVQSPSDADFPSMPFQALLGDHVGHLVMLDQMGRLLVRLVGETHSHEGSRSGSSSR